MIRSSGLYKFKCNKSGIMRDIWGVKYYWLCYELGGLRLRYRIKVLERSKNLLIYEIEGNEVLCKYKMILVLK